ncbi:MAG: helix-turn-helix domain-containing protein, partial [Altibacter sp.]|nr:helix-turn-helix domain-containing protein [Altibacter sp.]
IDANASGSSSLGQLADLLSTGTAAEWPVASKQATTIPLILKHAEISAGWSSVVIHLDDKTEDDAYVRTTGEKIEYMRDVFGISISHLARILRTSRPTIYSWIGDEEPRKQSIERIQQIYDIAAQWANMNPYHFSPGPLLKQTIGKSPSLLDRLEQDELDMEEIETGLTTILELMHRKRIRMDRSKERTQESKISDLDKEKNRHGLTQIVSSAE